MIIRNRDQLLSHGNIEGRRLVLDILEAGIDAADPYENVYNLIRVEDNKLIVGNERFPPGDWYGMTPPPGTPPRTGEPLVFDLSRVGAIYVVGGGKAAQRQALAIEHVLGDRITEGHINAKKGDSVYLKRIGVSLAGHPLPDEESVSGSRRIYEIQHKARKGDIVFLSESGGGTSLMALPAPGISLADLQEVYRLLYFECGAPMPVANAVRNQLTILRGLHPRDTGEATLIHIYTTETPPDLRVHTNERPSSVDAYQHAIDILKEYGIWDQVAESVRAFLLRADPAYAPLRPEEWFDGRKHSFRIMGPEYMLEGARLKAEQLGLRATVLVSSLSDVEAQPVAETMAYVAQEIEALDRPLPAPCVLLLGGELVVAVGHETGVGGRSQEFVLAAAKRIAGSKRIVIASADSDGSDGPTDYDGGIVDGSTVERATQAGVSIPEALKHHDSSTALAALGDAIHTGILRTNVRDLRVIYVADHLPPA